jgi:hypothetical protein
LCTWCVNQHKFNIALNHGIWYAPVSLGETYPPGWTLIFIIHELRQVAFHHFIAKPLSGRNYSVRIESPVWIKEHVHQASFPCSCSSHEHYRLLYSLHIYKIDRII